jgi:hypothetical protein
VLRERSLCAGAADARPRSELCRLRAAKTIEGCRLARAVRADDQSRIRPDPAIERELPKATIPPKRTDNLREENHACLLTFSPAHSAQVESRDFRAALQLD